MTAGQGCAWLLDIGTFMTGAINVPFELNHKNHGVNDLN